MRVRHAVILVTLVSLSAAPAGADPGHDRNHDHSPTPSAAPSVAPGHERDHGGQDDRHDASDNGEQAGKGPDSPLTGITESEAQRARRLAHAKEQHDHVTSALRGRETALTREQQDLLARHNRVVARLQWIQTWADNEKKTDVASRAQAALAKEDARFYAKLAELATKAGGAK